MNKKAKRLILLTFILFFILYPTALSQQDPHDPNGPDSVLLEEAVLYVYGPPYSGKAVFSVILENDEVVVDFCFPFVWTGPAFMDSASFQGTRVEDIDYHYREIDNENKTVIIGGASSIYIPPGRGPIANLFFALSDTGILVIDSTSTSHFPFAMDGVDPVKFKPQFEKGIFHLEPSDIKPGDVDLDDIVDLVDVIHLAYYCLKGGSTPEFLPCADVNSDCQIDLADVIYLANYILKSGASPVPGCAW